MRTKLNNKSPKSIPKTHQLQTSLPTCPLFLSRHPCPGRMLPHCWDIAGCCRRTHRRRKWSRLGRRHRRCSACRTLSISFETARSFSSRNVGSLVGERVLNSFPVLRYPNRTTLSEVKSCYWINRKTRWLDYLSNIKQFTKTKCAQSQFFVKEGINPRIFTNVESDHTY